MFPGCDQHISAYGKNLLSDNTGCQCGLGDIERSKVPLKTTFTMKTSDKEKLWSISTQDGRAKVFRNNVPLKSSNNGQEYGFLLGVEVKVQSDKKMIQVSNNFKCAFC